MTDAPNPQQHDGSHDGPIRTPKQLIWAVLWAHIVPIGAILLLVWLRDRAEPSRSRQRRPRRRCDRQAHPAGRPRRSARRLRHRLAEEWRAGLRGPVHRLPHRRRRRRPEARRPAGAWGPRIATGYDALLHSALAGKGAMGPQGGGDFTDLEIGRAVVYMANKSGGKFDEPKTAPATTSTAKVNEGGDAAAAAAVAAAKTAMAGVKSTAATATAPQPRPRPLPPARRRRCSHRPARSAMRPASPARRRSATRRPGRRASRRASTG